MRRILLLISFIFSGFIASAQSEYNSDTYHPFLTAPQRVCSGAYASMHAWLQDINGSNHNKYAVDSVRWTIDMPVSPNFVYSQTLGANPLVRWIANNGESITFNVTEVGTYTVTARVYFTIWQSGAWRAKYTEVTKTFISEDCTMDECEGTYSPATNFKETFGTFTVNEGPRPLDPPATIGYNYDGDGELKDDYYAIHYSARIGGKNEWGDVFDHTNDGYGGMLIANSSEEPRLFYSREVTGLCPGAKYNFSAWFINLNSLGVINSVCESWNGSYQYAGVTFVVRNADNNAIIGQFNTNDVSMDLSRENGGDQRMTGWQKFGGTVTLGPGVTDVIVEIRNNNPGGCGNDIAVDDIEFAFCAPKIYSYIDGLGVTSDMVCPGAELTLTSVIQPADYFTDPVYRWEYSKNGGSFVTISEPGYTGVNTPTLGIGPGVLQEGDVIKYQLMVIEAGNLAADERQCYTPSNFVMLQVASLPTINATRDVLCRGDSAILTASPLEAPGVVGYETFTWTGPDILPWPATEIQPKNQILIRPQVTSQYGVTGTITYGQYNNGQPRVCTKKDSLIITVDQPPVVELGPDMLLCVNTPVTLDAGTANAGYDITWQPGNLHTQTINITAPSLPATQEYKVNVQNGQCTTRDSVKITSVKVTEAVIDGNTEYCTDLTPIIRLEPLNPPDPGAVPSETVTWSFVGDSHGATLYTNNPTGAPNNRHLLNMPFNIPVTVRMTMQVSGTDCISTDEKTFIVETPTNAAARSLAQCTNVFTLDADPVKDTSMTGTWSVISGDVTINAADIHNPNAVATINNGPQIAVLRWTVVKNRLGSACPPSQVDITLDYTAPATISVSPNVNICHTPSSYYFVLPWTSANDPVQYDMEAVGPNPMPGFTDVIDEPLYTTEGDFYVFYPTDVDPGEYTFRIRAEKMTADGNICSTESLFTLTINTPSTAPTISLPTPNICAGSSATLTLSGGTLGSNTEWVWYEGNCVTGTEIARGVTSITVSPTATTTYSVRAEDTTGTSACGNSSCVSATVNVYQMPADAVAGADQENCDDATFAMNADAPSISGAQGTWTASPAVTISDIHDRNATVTVPAGTTATLTWTVTNGPCISTADNVILVNRNPVANNTIQQDQVLCPPNTTPAELTGTAAVAGGIGTYTYQWQSSASATGTFTDIGGATGANYQPGALTATTYFRRTVTSGPCISNSNVIEVKVAAIPNFTITDVVSACNASGKFEVQYAIISGAPNRYDLLAIPGYELPDFIDLFNQSFSGGQITITYPSSTPAGEYRFRIVMRNADGCEKADTVIATLESLSLPAWIETTPSRICEGQTVTLTAKGGTLGSNADWVWYKDNCGSGTPIGTGTSITFQPTETTTFAVRAESNRACKNTACATATVTVDEMPAAPNAGQDQEHCNNDTFIMDAAVPNIGTGTWTGLTAGMTISDLHDPKATVTLPAGQTATLTWTITNNACTTTGDNITLVNRDEIGNNVIQDDQVICPNTQPGQLTGVGVPSGGSGTYTYEWEYSTTDATTGFTTVPSATGSIFQPPVLTQTTWYRRIVRSGAECESVSNVVEITVSTVSPTVTGTPPAESTACNTGTDYTTLFGTPTFDHPLGLALVITHRDSTAAQTCGFTITRIWTATDPCGKTATTQQTITVTDNTAPVFATAAPKDTIVDCSHVPAFDDIAVTDECSAVDYEKTEKNEPIAGACANSYLITRTWTATDACGNETVLTQTITVQDTTKPVFGLDVPADTTVDCDAIPNQDDLAASDDCSGLVTVSKRQDTVRAPGACINNYELRRVWIAEDICGNQDSVIQTITVQDTTKPVFNVPTPNDTTVNCDAIPLQQTLTATDNCNSALVTVTPREDTIPIPGACLNSYQLRRVWIAEDICGNQDSVIQTITVQDTTKPVFNVPTPNDTTVNCDAIPLQQTLTATDNCNSALVTVTPREDTIPIPGACLNSYQLRRVWIAEDICGNRDSVIQTITVQDTTKPVFNVPTPNDTTVNCDAIPLQQTLTATDNCNSALVTVTPREDTIPIPGACLNSYQLRRVWIAEDICGNRDSVIQTITVQDTTKPVFNVPTPNDTTVNCDAIPLQQTLTATDNCNSALVTVTPREDTISIPGACLNSYQLRRVWIAEDICGNQDSVIQTITVQDTTKPVFNVPTPNDTTVNCDAIPLQQTLTATDNCNSALVTVTPREDTIPIPGACLNSYQLRRVWIAEDICGNQDSVIQTITVQDTTKPVFGLDVPSDTTVNCDAIPLQQTLTATDNCNSALVTVTPREDTIPIPGACLNSYQLRRVWIAEDICGNQDSVIQTITVQDTTKPVFNVPTPNDTTVNCDAIPLQQTLTATDNCNSALVTVTPREDTIPIPDACLNSYQLRRVWIAEDICGNQDSVIQTITVQDTTKPVFNVPTPNDTTVNCDAIPLQQTLTATDNCNSALVTVTPREDTIPIPGACLNSYQLRRVWIAEDICGNQDSVIQTITVQDTTKPVFNVPTPNDTTVNCDAIPLQQTLTATDNCNSALVTVTPREDTIPIPGACLNSYQLRRVWIAEDICGNQDSVIQTITVQDTTKPVFNVPTPNDTTVNCDAIPLQQTLTATDNCNSALVTVTPREDTIPIPGACLNSYQLRRVWIAEDICGNRDSVIQTITVQDTTKPVFNVPTPNDTTVNCDAIPLQQTLTATDNCNSALVTVTPREDTIPIPGACLNSYQLRRVWIAEDICGNQDSVIQTITVQDTTKPVFNVPTPNDTTVNCDAIPLQQTLTATDNCNSALVTVTPREDTIPIPGACLNSYQLRRVWIAEDICGNQDSVIQTITVQDTTKPVFLDPAPANTTVECDAIPIQGDLAASDNCNGLVTVSKRQDTVRTPGACVNNYQLRRVWIATDICGNQDSVIQTITVRDTKPPVFTTTAPADTTVECSAIPDQIDLRATDLCSPAGTVRVLENQTRQNIPGACANNYLLIRTWTALDACNNATTVTQTITVVDRTAPVFTSTTPANVTVECDNIPEASEMTARDNCSATNKVTIDFDETREDIPGACVNNYRLRRTWTATDECGNFTTAVQIITVRDTKPPVFSAAAPANVTVECDAVPDQPDLAATDNCSGIVNITKAQQRFDSTCANTYRLVRTWTATDVCGNSTTLTQTIIVADRTKPVFSTPVPRDTTVNCNAIPLPLEMRADDNCAPVVNITYDEQHVDIPGACTNNYKLLRTWTANDGCGNITRVIQVITVQDTTRPVFTLPIPADVTVNCDAIPMQPDLTASDNCSPAAGVTVTKAQRRENIPGACVNNYRLIRTWTARDVCGNTAIATQTITVQDTTRPVFTLPVPVDVTVECSAIPTMPDLTATDNCSVTSRVTIVKAERTEPIPGACVNNYRLIRTWTATDECGNSTTLTQVITVTDTTAPAFTMPVPADATVDCNNIPAQPQLTATDNCSATNRITVTRAQRREDIPGACVNNYRLIRTWTATDECGNARTVSQTITVQDTTRPAFTVSVPMDATVECSAIPVMPDLNVTDNCTPSNRVTVVKAERREDIPGACANNYRLIRTWTATDECGNSRMVQQVLTVIDRTAPTFTIATPANATVECDAIPVQPDLSATDNCSMANNVSVVKAERRENIPGACVNNYRLIRTWTATDECGNSRTVEQVLTVVDRTPPVFTTSVPANITAECDAIPAMPDLTATDNCSPMNVRIVKDEVRENISGACVNNYLLIRTWTAIDECGNSTVMKQTVTVEDRTAPVFTLQPPTNITVNCDEVPAAPLMTATDNCSGNNVTVRYSFTKRQLSGECISNYRLTRTWIATDECGNSATATQVITVIDTTRPVFNMAAPADTTVNCDAIPSPVSISASDNCSLPGAVRVTFNQQRENIPGACASNYRLIYTWMAVDECGNTAVMRQVITVQDTTRPVIDTPPADITLSCGQGIPTEMIELNATDNCDGSFPKKVKYTIDPYTPDLCNGYTITRRWSITDECGNAADDVVQRIIVLPCPKPELLPDTFTNCSSMPFITLKTNGRVNRPVYTLVGVTPANAVPTPITSSNPMFNVNGATTASFVVRDGLTGCVSDTMTYTISYLNMPVVNLGADTSLCGGNGMVLDAGPANFGYNISWSTGETTQRIRVTQAGTYKVTVSNGMCTATDSIVVSVIPMPLIDLPDTTICRGQSVTLDATVAGASSYFWSTGANTPSINVSTQERFWVQVIKNGCITIDTIDVTVNPPPDITLSRDTTICPGQTVMLTVNTSAGRIMWGTGEEGSSILVSRAGTYSVAVYRDNCVVRESVRVAERPNMDFELGPDRIMCPGGSIIVDARHPDAATYRWNDGDLNPVKSISAGGVYKLGILDRFCDRYQEDSIKVTIAGPPTLNLGNDTIICKGRRHILKANAVNATAYQWSTGATTSYIEVSEPGTYSVTVFNDCGSATDEITIDVKECDSKPEMPNAFSPNGDGKNDVFRPQVRGPMYDYELRVFNRWGELVYLSKDQYEGWDGTYKGRPVDIGTFVWWLTYKKVRNGPAFIIKGDVTVVR